MVRDLLSDERPSTDADPNRMRLETESVADVINTQIRDRILSRESGNEILEAIKRDEINNNTAHRILGHNQFLNGDHGEETLKSLPEAAQALFGEGHLIRFHEYQETKGARSIGVLVEEARTKIAKELQLKKK